MYQDLRRETLRPYRYLHSRIPHALVERRLANEAFVLCSMRSSQARIRVNNASELATLVNREEAFAD